MIYEYEADNGGDAYGVKTTFSVWYTVQEDITSASQDNCIKEDVNSKYPTVQ